MRLFEQRLLQGVAVFRRVHIDAVDQAFVIQFEVVSKQREPKPALSLKRTVAGAAVAALFAQQRHNVTAEVGSFLTVGIGKTLGCRRDGGCCCSSRRCERNNKQAENEVSHNSTPEM